MPPKDFDRSNIRFGTYDGDELVDLGDIKTITSEELQAESEEYRDVRLMGGEVTFTGTIKLETNNERKMKGKPLLRGKTNIHRFWRDLKKTYRGMK